MLIKTIQLEADDEQLFSKETSLLAAAAELTYHTINCSALNAEELRREKGLEVSKCLWSCGGCSVTSVGQMCEQCFIIRTWKHGCLRMIWCSEWVEKITGCEGIGLELYTVIKSFEYYDMMLNVVYHLKFILYAPVFFKSFITNLFIW